MDSNVAGGATIRYWQEKQSNVRSWSGTPLFTGITVMHNAKTGETQQTVVSSALCPDQLRYEHLGAADGWRGRVVRGFFWALRWWRS